MSMGQVYWGTHGALSAGASPIVLMLGDSWFWYPVDNLAIEVQAGFPNNDVVVIGKNGAEATDWQARLRKDIDFAFDMYGADVQAFMLSGGGNDIAGTADFLRILADDCSKAGSVAECYRLGQPEGIIASIMGAYRAVILTFRAHNRSAPVFCHNYDHAWPTGKGLFGPADWLKVPMDKAKVPKALRRDVFKDLVKRLRAAQLALSREKGLGPIVAVASAGTLPEDEAGKESWWANELHPTPKGFKRLAQKAFLPALKKVVTL